MLKFLEYVLIVLLLIVSVLIIVTFFVYTGLDKRRFRIERQLDKVLPIVKKWVESLRILSEAGVLGSETVAEACRQFLSTRKLRKRLDALSVLASERKSLSCRLGVEMTDEQTELYAGAQDLENMLRDFFSIYPIMSEDYNRRLEKPVYRQLGRVMGFRPAPDLAGLEKL